MKKLLSGNEAVARGLWEAGTTFASAYPGTPSTEILENVAHYKDIISQWSPNEKVAYEVAAGVAMGGGRAFAAMKHVGINVAADPLFSSSYSGAYGGFIVVSADDPAMHSSQNEQDNRNLARASKIAMLEPSDSQECKDFIKHAFEISEEFDTPVMFRMTTRICHSMTTVEIDENIKFEKVVRGPYEHNYQKNVLLPANARKRHVFVEERLKKLEEYGNKATALNRIEWGDKKKGIIACGISYQYVKEAMPDVSILKLGLTNPLPMGLIKEFASQVEELYVVEELDPFIEEQLKAVGIKITGKEILSNIGEFNTEVVAKAFGVERKSEGVEAANVPLPIRPPVMCAGCSHRGVFYTLHRMKAIVTGDIGCYTLGALPPLLAMDSCLCMGASVGMAEGMGIALKDDKRKNKIVGVIGDSTFFHSGITGLIDMVYNKSDATIMILDNRITAMTGHQENPGTGATLSGDEAHQIDLVALCKATGVKRVVEIDPYNLKEVRSVLKEEMNADEPSVIITKAECMLVRRKAYNPPAEEDHEKCVECGMCIKLGCPAIENVDGKPVIDKLFCTGCTLCVQTCGVNALSIEGYDPKDGGQS